jgi:hypothetical protein
VNNKFRNIKEDFENNVDDAAWDEKIIVIVNANQNNDWSISRSRFEIFKSEFESNFRAITQSSSENQVNFINCIDNSGFRQSDDSHSIQRSLLSSSLYSDREHKFTIVIIRDVRLRLSLSFDERNDRFISSLLNDWRRDRIEFFKQKK